MTGAPTQVLALVPPAGRPALEAAVAGGGGGLHLRAFYEVEALADALSEDGAGAVVWEESFGLEPLARLIPNTPHRAFLLLASAWDAEKVGRALRAGAQDVLLVEELSATGTPHRIRAAIERHTITTERDQVLDRLRKLEQYKTEFVNTAAHELNSPLTPIRLQLHLLQNKQSKGLSAAQRHSLTIVGRNVERLIQLVADILDAARLQASRLTVKKQAVDLQRLALEAAQSQRAAGAAKKVEVVFELGTPQMVEADPDRITQVFTNLLTNALKFTREGGKVQLSVRREGDAAVVRVQDTGIGLRPEDFPRLFQPFSQTHEWVEGPRSGSGLGLYICQGIVEQHGGRIWCDSPGPNKGATFAFALPLQKEAPTAARQREGAAIRRVKRFWPILYFTCPTCGSRDINMRVLKNRYECRACTDEWQ